jgi:hypothetical protein
MVGATQYHLIQACQILLGETYEKYVTLDKFVFLEHNITIRGCIQKFPDWIDNVTNNNNNKHSLRSNTKGYGGKIY